MLLLYKQPKIQMPKVVPLGLLVGKSKTIDQGKTRTGMHIWFHEIFASTIKKTNSNKIEFDLFIAFLQNICEIVQLG